MLLVLRTTIGCAYAGVCSTDKDCGAKVPHHPEHDHARGIEHALETTNGSEDVNDISTQGSKPALIQL